MALTAAEQYLLELVNRARLDPVAEARRLGVDLNAGLSAGTITAASKQALAPNVLLESAAIKHSQWMLATDTISHTGAGGSTPYQRAVAEGYKPGWVGENISWRGTTGAFSLESYVDVQHKDLFLSAGHRSSMLFGTYREIGIAQEAGIVRSGGVDYRSSVITEVFGAAGTARFVTGVAFADADANGFYSMGEGVAGVTFAAAGRVATTAAAGGYGLSVDAANATAALDLSGTVGRQAFSVKLDMTVGNVKLDVVNASLLLSSGSITLVSGLNNVTLLGVERLNAIGNAQANALTGNAANNSLSGNSGNDTLIGNDGDDFLWSSSGNDVAYGGAGRDTIQGGPGSDVLYGGGGADFFVIYDGSGYDRIAGFIVGTDRLRIDDAHWTGQRTASEVVADFARVTSSGVMFDFGGGDQLILSSLRTTAGLAGSIDII